MQLTTEEQGSELIQQFASRHCRMLAEKIETHAAFLRARDQGFVDFQSYFFRRPEMLSTRDMPAHRLHYLRMFSGSISPGSRYPRTGKADPGGGVGVLSAAPVLELGHVQLHA